MLREPTTMQCGSLEMEAAGVCARAHSLLCDCMMLVCCTFTLLHRGTASYD